MKTISDTTIESATYDPERREHAFRVRAGKFLLQLYKTKFGWQCMQLNALDGIVPPETVKDIQDKLDRTLEDDRKEA